MSILEGDTGTTATATNTAAMRITLSQKAPAGGVTVTYTVAGGSASLGSDFTKAYTKSVTFAQGQFQKTVSIAIRPDRGVEPDETVMVTINSAAGADTRHATGTLTIVNDD